LRLLLQPGGTVVELNHPDLLLGRHSQADVRLPLPDVSRRHCRFQYVNGSWHVLDLNSLNGVFVNDQRVEQAVLCQGDHIRIGGFTFVVDLQGTVAAPRADSDDLASALFKNRVRTIQFLPNDRRAS
jgi:pSer/pThr/pTyr-binding forkhead associated (FHA) protein